MLKALIRKQFAELHTFFTQDRKTGKRRSKGGMTGYIILYAVLFVGLGYAFFELAGMFASAMIPMGLGWLYYAFMGMLALFFGVFGGVFNTYASLYLAKDNEALLAMPIPPSYILLSRMLGVLYESIFYSALVYIPTVIVYLKNVGFSASAFIGAILSTLLLGLFCTVICCILGWVVAVVSVKLKNKSAITIIISLVFFAAYYIFCMNYYSVIQNILLHLDTVSAAIKGKAYPLYIFGSAAVGEVIPLLIFAAFVFISLAAVIYVLSRSFVKISSLRGGSSAKTEYKADEVRASGMENALFRRELKRFTSNATYMLNCALGSILMPVVGIAMLIFKDTVRDILSIFAAPGSEVLVLFALAAVCTACSMNDITSPSISLEGKNLWIVQSMPVSPVKIFEAKKRLHLVLTVPPVIIFAAATCIVLQTDIVSSVLVLVFAVCFVMFVADLGLVLNLRMPNLAWTNQAAPIKQSLPPMICIFGGWLMAIILTVAGYFALKVMSGTVYLVICVALFALGARLLDRWLRTKGSAIFANL